MSRRRPYHTILVLAGLLALISGVVLWQDHRHNRQPRLNAALQDAIEREDTSRVIALLDSGADPNTFLEWQPPKSGIQRVEEFLRIKPARVHLNIYGPTPPLAMAAEEGNAEIVHALLEKGASINGPAFILGDPPIVCAARKGHFEIVRLLLEQGANSNAMGQTQDGTPALLYPIIHKDVEMVRLLLKWGADPNSTCGEAQDIYWVARNNYHPQIIALLESAGGKERPNIYYPPKAMPVRR